MQFRDLRADEIEVRVGNISKTGKGLTLLLYKNARCDMAILDETVGEFNWERRHYECKGNLYCAVAINRNYGIKDAPPDWVEKSDCGVESREDGNGNEKKGEASDSFKRACTNWGIGRELYTSPFIWLNAADAGLKDNGKGGFTTSNTFLVDEIQTEKKKIIGLRLKNSKTDETVFEWGECITPMTYEEEDKKEGKKEQPDLNSPAPPTMIKEITEYFKEKDGLIETLVHYSVNSVEELTVRQATAILNRIRAKKKIEEAKANGQAGNA